MNKGKKKQDERMATALKVFVVTAVVALPLGYFIGNSTTDSSTDKDSYSAEESSNEEMLKTHSHSEMLAVDADGAPEISMLMVTKDPKSGWNLHFETENFKFSPENVSTAHVAGEGHAHVYVDGVKVNRLYSGDYYLGELDEGEHVVRVTLNANNHSEYAVDGEVIEASMSINDSHHDDEGTEPHSHDN